MQEILLDEASFSQPEDVHAYLARELQFPSYYGANLDALNDCLEEIAVPVGITVYMADAPAPGAPDAPAKPDTANTPDTPDTPSVPGESPMTSWFPKLVRGLLRAARNNENLEVLVHATSLGAFARLAACPGMLDLLEGQQFITQGIIACLSNQDETAS